MEERLMFASDYMEGAHPAIMERLMETNIQSTPGYGTDEYSENARELIRKACGCPDALVYFLIGGTQTNATVIDSVLHRYEGVLAADTGHVAVHEAGAIEFTGHKVLTIQGTAGKISAADVKKYVDDYYADDSYEHMVKPGMVYISQPTEYGTMYSLEELTALSEVCHSAEIPLYVDGARLAYALACPSNDVTLKDLARLADVFYIGGTKCGCLFGEAVVVPDPELIPHFFSLIKQHGALLAKGRLSGIQFETLFKDGLYEKLGEPAIKAAEKIRAVLKDNGYKFYLENPTNQILIVLENKRVEELKKDVELGFWEKYDDSHTVMRIATSWATTDEKTEKLIELLKI